MRLHYSTVLAIITGALAASPVAGAPPVQAAKLIASDGESFDTMGYSSAITSTAGVSSATPDIAIVGIPYDIVGTVVNKGSANVYKRSASGAWVYEGKFVASDGAANDYFGAAVAAFGDTAIVGAPGDDMTTNADQGSAYIFKRAAGGAWTQVAKVSAVDGAAGDYFGLSIGITNTTLAGTTTADMAVIGAPYDDFTTLLDQGSAYIFTKSTAGVWAQEGKFWAIGADGAANENFGTAVAVRGDRALLGCPFDDFSGFVDRGSAYIWKRASSGAWSQDAKIVAADGAGGDLFGASLSIASGQAIVGAPGDDFGTVADRGSAYVFQLSGATTWNQAAKLVAGDGLASDFFGSSVSIDDTVAVATAHGDDGLAGSGTATYTDIGAAYLFTRAGTATWTEKARFTAADGQAGKLFGDSAAQWGAWAVVGAAGDDIGTPLRQDQGSAYVFELLPIDCNNNGVPDAEDIASGIAQDCNANQIPDSCDLASGASQDCNGNLIPDSCELGGGGDSDSDGKLDACERALGDFDLNGLIDGLDMALILSAWGSSTPAYADLNHDGSIGGGDLTAIFSRWGVLP